MKCGRDTTGIRALVQSCAMLIFASVLACKEPLNAGNYVGPRSRFKLLLNGLLLVAVVMWGSSQAASVSDAPPNSAVYLVVIDRSGSMTERASPGKSKWEEMKEAAISFINTVPFESRIWLCTFSTTRDEPRTFDLNGPIDLQEATRYINRVQQPNGWTALYDTMAYALDAAKEFSKDNPNRYISLMVYTDGIDTIYKEGPAKEKKKADILKNFKSILGSCPNLWIYQTTIGDKSAPPLSPDPSNHIITVTNQNTITKPLSVTVTPSRLSLPNPQQNPLQPLELTVVLSKASENLLKDNPATVSFQSADGVTASILPSTVPLRRGKAQFALRIENATQLAVQRDYAGLLRIIYSAPVGYVVQGPDRIEVAFQKQEPPRIVDLRPTNNATFAANRPVFFYASTLQGAKILWDFGDGTSGTGSEITHVYVTPADRKVTVKVESDPRLGTTMTNLLLHIIDVGIAWEPINKPLVESSPCVFQCSGRGGVQRYEWIVDGIKYQGTRRPDGGEGSVLTNVFDSPGKHSLRVVGYAETAVVESEERVVQVEAKPKLWILQPLEGYQYPPDTNIVFKAATQGGVEKVAWQLLDKKDDSLIKTIENSVKDGNAEFAYTFPAQAGERDVVVKAVGFLRDGQAAKPPEAEPITIQVRFPVSTVKILTPANQATAHFRKPIEFGARAEGAVSKIRWLLFKQGEDQPIYQRDADRFEFSFPQQPGQKEMDVLVIARGEMPSSNVRAAPAATNVLKLVTPPLRPVICLPMSNGVEQISFRFQQMVEPRLKMEGDAQTVIWDFGDGTKGEGITPPPHFYTNYGTFTLRARATCKWSGNVEDAAARNINIIHSPPQTDFRILVKEAPATDVGKGSIVKLMDITTGDVATRCWFANGREIARDVAQTDYACKESGTTTFELQVWSPDGKTAQPVVHSVRVHNYLVSLLIAVVSLISYGFLMFIFSGNGPRCWTLTTAQTPKPESGRSKNEEDTVFNLDTHVKDFWSYIHKHARLPMAVLFPTSTHWTTGAGKDDYMEVAAISAGRTLTPSLSFSSSRDSRVPPMEEWKPNETYRLIDNRAPKDESDRDVLIKLNCSQGSVRDLFMKLFLTCLLGGGLVFVYFLV